MIQGRQEVKRHWLKGMATGIVFGMVILWSWVFVNSWVAAASAGAVVLTYKYFEGVHYGKDQY